MRVLAARFAEQHQAWEALEIVRKAVAGADLAVAPLAHPGEAARGEAVLAGRVADQDAQLLIQLVEAAGGQLVTNEDEH